MLNLPTLRAAVLVAAFCAAGLTQSPPARASTSTYRVPATASPATTATAGVTGAIPSFDEVRRGWRSSESLLLDRHGEVIERLRTDPRVRRGAWVPLPDVSPALRQAILLSEDQRFYEHGGVDWRAAAAAAWGHVWNGKSRGASTLTMQLAGLLDEDLRQRAGGRSLPQKIGQAILAARLERQWRKDQILEAYLNLAPFRGELTGIDALSRTLFGKAPDGLQDWEAAIAAALVRSPGASAPLVAQRACGVLALMRDGPDKSGTARSGPNPPSPKALDCTLLAMQTRAAFARRGWPAAQGIAPHLARRLIRPDAQGNAPAAVPSTLDARLQRLALQSLQQQIRELHGRNVSDGAAVVLDNATGDVLAWVGSTGELSQAAEVDGVLAKRQPGSTLKPFLYAQAIAERRLTAASLLEDTPAQLPTASGLYVPQNYDRHFKGWVSVRTALASSLNVPAVRTLELVSPDAFARQLARLGIDLPESGGYYGYSLALGSAEVSLLQLTNAYRALANNGRYGPVRFAMPMADAARPAAAPVSTAAIDPGAAFIVGDILADPNARARTFGTDSILDTRFWSAVKTGTSKDMRDNWAVGWNACCTVGVWVGNASGAAMWDVSGESGAAPVWATLMRALHDRRPSRANAPPQPPGGIVRQAVRFGAEASGAPIEAPRQEWFLAGTQQTLFATAGGAPGKTDSATGDVPPRILTPVEGTILALDPDIPPARQRLFLQADPGTAPARGLRWRVRAVGSPEGSGQGIGHGSRAQWFPWPGRQVIELRGARGQLLDARRVEVRGAGVKTTARP